MTINHEVKIETELFKIFAYIALDGIPNRLDVISGDGFIKIDASLFGASAGVLIWAD